MFGRRGLVAKMAAIRPVAKTSTVLFFTKRADISYTPRTPKFFPHSHSESLWEGNWLTRIDCLLHSSLGPTHSPELS